MYTISLVMIVRNEQRCLGRALDSVRDWVDSMLVLDTGSTDSTVELAKQHGARVSHFNWIDDFSAARNAALDLSHSDWNVVLDADEVLADGGPALKALRDRTPNFVGRVEQFNTFSISGENGAPPTHAASSWIPRVLPRGVKYQGSIHEQPVSSLCRIDLPIRLLHDGYHPQQIQTKGTRNLNILKAALASSPHDPYLQYQTGKEYDVHEEFTEALPYYDAALRLLDHRPKRQPAWRHDLILRTLFALKACGRLESALQLAQTELVHWPDSPDLFFTLGDILLDVAVAEPTRCAQMLPMIERAWRQCILIGENPHLEGAVHGRGSHLAQHNLDLLHRLQTTGL